MTDKKQFSHRIAGFVVKLIEKFVAENAFSVFTVSPSSPHSLHISVVSLCSCVPLKPFTPSLTYLFAFVIASHFCQRYNAEHVGEVRILHFTGASAKFIVS